MATSICLHFCKLLRSSLSICLEFAPPQENQELTHEPLVVLSKILTADRRINFPSFIYLEGFSGESGNS